MSPRAIHVLLVVLLLAASPLRALCYDVCISGPEVVSSADDGPACHEPHDAAPTSRSEPSDDGCRHSGQAPVMGPRAVSKTAATSASVPIFVHASPGPTHDIASATPRLAAVDPLLRVVPAPRGFLTPLRI